MTLLGAILSALLLAAIVIAILYFGTWTKREQKYLDDYKSKDWRYDG